MHSGAKLLRKTLTGTERAGEQHKAHKSKSLVRIDKKVRRVILLYIFSNNRFVDIL